MPILIGEFSVGQMGLSSWAELVTERSDILISAFSHIASASSRKFSVHHRPRMFSPDSALVCVPQRAVRVEAEPLHASPVSTTRKSSRLVILLEKWRTRGVLCRSWAAIHPIPHKVQSLTHSLEELEMFLFIVTINTDVIVTYTMPRCFFLSWNRANEVRETIIKSKNMFPIFLG